jgi:hypothetical protein
MDVVAGETAGVEGQLLLLYPVLFILQVYRVWIQSMASSWLLLILNLSRMSFVAFGSSYFTYV